MRLSQTKKNKNKWLTLGGQKGAKEEFTIPEVIKNIEDQEIRKELEGSVKVPKQVNLFVFRRFPFQKTANVLESVTALPQIKELNFSWCKIEGGFDLLSQFCKNNTNIKSLNAVSQPYRNKKSSSKVRSVH